MKGDSRKVRVMLLGITGLDKGFVLGRLEESLARSIAITGKIRLIDFEKEYIDKEFAHEFHSYLDAEQDKQRDLWRRCWARMSKDVKNDSVFVALHGACTRPLFGIRSPIGFEEIRGFGFTQILTLIDDIYDIWYRTQRRAENLSHIGIPSLAELTEARRSEILIGDIIANFISDEYRTVQNFVLAIKHPMRAMVRLLEGEVPTHKRIYVSHPISAPRRRALESDPTGINEINQILQVVNEFDIGSTDAVFFYPLTIDELPLQRPAPISQNNQVIFSRSDRWDVRDFISSDSFLCDMNGLPSGIALSSEELEEVVGMIKPDIRSRDLRLIRQSRRLVVLNPWYEGRRPRGVRAEIDSAVYHHMRIHIWQDKCHDPTGECAKNYKYGNGGTFGSNSYPLYVHGSLEECLEMALKN